MIRKVVIRRFKKFEDVTFDLPGHVVLAGPNNTGKTTMLQAVAAWSLAFEAWKVRNDFHRHGVAYTKVPITRHVFSAVPLRAFDLLWRDRDTAAASRSKSRPLRGGGLVSSSLRTARSKYMCGPNPIPIRQR